MIVLVSLDVLVDLEDCWQREGDKTSDEETRRMWIATALMDNPWLLTKGGKPHREARDLMHTIINHKKEPTLGVWSAGEKVKGLGEELLSWLHGWDLHGDFLVITDSIKQTLWTWNPDLFITRSGTLAALAIEGSEAFVAKLEGFPVKEIVDSPTLWYPDKCIRIKADSIEMLLNRNAFEESTWR